MRKGIVKYNNIVAGILTEEDEGLYCFVYDKNYMETYPNQFICFSMPVKPNVYSSNKLFPFFDGLIPEGWLLNIASESWKINKSDRMGLLLSCCQNAIGAVSVHPISSNRDE